MKVVEGALEKLGFQILSVAKTTQNGPDMWVLKDGRPYSVEVKHVRIQRKRCAGIRPVEPARRNDDLIAIVFPSGYVLVEPMKDHLRLCSPKGYRTITGLI